MLESHGHIAQHVSDIGLLAASDVDLWRAAQESGVILVTKDEDFARLHRDAPGPVVVWVRLGNTTRRALIEWFEPLLPKIEELVESGEQLIELR